MIQLVNFNFFCGEFRVDLRCLVWWPCQTAQDVLPPIAATASQTPSPFGLQQMSVQQRTSGWICDPWLQGGRAVASLVASHVFAEELVLTGIFEQEMGWNSSIYLNLSNYPIRFLFECLNILARNKAGGRFGISMSSPVQLYPGNVAGALA